jgi:signal transduction histidine kinase
MVTLKTKILRLIIFTELVLLPLCLLLATGYHIQKLSNKSVLFADAIRNDILLNDQRSILQKTQVAINDHEFTSVDFVRADDLLETDQKFEGKIVIPVLAKPGDEKSEIGKIFFQYSLFTGIREGLYLWIILSLSFLFTIPFIKQSISRHLKNEMESTKLREMGSLVASIAHDIRSPLSALQLISNVPDLNREEVRDILKTASQRIDGIAQGLLNEFKQKEDLNCVLSSANDLIHSIAKEKRAEFSHRKDIEIVFPDSPDHALFCDPLQVTRIISNLINNSVEAKRLERICITFSTGKTRGKTWIKVTDNGQGIPRKLLKKVGKERIDSTKSGSSSGSGIGLLNAAKSIERMLGKIEIESKEGVGTTFTLFLKDSK